MKSVTIKARKTVDQRYQIEIATRCPIADDRDGAKLRDEMKLAITYGGQLIGGIQIFDDHILCQQQVKDMTALVSLRIKKHPRQVVDRMVEKFREIGYDKIISALRNLRES